MHIGSAHMGRPLEKGGDFSHLAVVLTTSAILLTLVC